MINFSGLFTADILTATFFPRFVAYRLLKMLVKTETVTVDVLYTATQSLAMVFCTIRLICLMVNSGPIGVSF
ncbi:MAG: hypothetical protein AAF960_08010 [Bacteroidota bacterium]